MRTVESSVVDLAHTMVDLKGVQMVVRLVEWWDNRWVELKAVHSAEKWVRSTAVRTAHKTAVY